MIVNHAPSEPILAQFPSGSVSANLAFQLSDKMLSKGEHGGLVNNCCPSQKGVASLTDKGQTRLNETPEYSGSQLAGVLKLCDNFLPFRWQSANCSHITRKMS